VSSLPDRIRLREVGPRDGLQAEAPLSVDQRVDLIDALLTAGVTHLEVAAFVSPSAVPAMADALEVVRQVGAPEGVVRAALVPNVRGAAMALEAGIDELTVTVSASATYNQRNVRMAIDDSIEQIAEICRLAGAVQVDAVLSCAFGSPYEGDVPVADVAVLCERLRAVGASAVTLADTTGMATPRSVAEVLAATGTNVGLHLHDSRGTALVNLYAGMLAGVRRFDTSVGGLGGSPFAAGAAGNVATEEVVAMCDDLGVHTGLGVELLIEAALLAERLIGHPVPSRVAHAGPRTRRAERT
jgi:hydroxymethylglutaryl-CoA lyase